MTHFYTFMKTYFIQLIPTQWEDSIEMTNNKEQSEHKRSLLNFKVHLCLLQSACTALPSYCPSSPKLQLSHFSVSQGSVLKASTKHIDQISSSFTCAISSNQVYFTQYFYSCTASFIGKAQVKVQALIKHIQRWPFMYLHSLNSLSIQNRTEEEDCNCRNTFQWTTRYSNQISVLIDLSFFPLNYDVAQAEFQA